jgi:DNA polymerase III epsilon subunit-like protein
MPEETYICVDVETAGPIPGEYALLSIGACLVMDIATNYYVELKPDKQKTSDEAMAVHGLSLESLKRTGIHPKDALVSFTAWIKSVTPDGSKPVFVAFNAPFDWMFIHDYYFRYLGENPFGHSALDIKAYFMGQTGVEWGETSLRQIATRFMDERHLTHNALSDAQDQAEIFRMMLNQKSTTHLEE